MDKLLLYKALKNKSGAEISASGNPVTLSGTLADNPLKECKIYGWSKQDGDPTPENPVEIESAGMKWSTGKNLFSGFVFGGTSLRAKNGIITTKEGASYIRSDHIPCEVGKHYVYNIPEGWRCSQTVFCNSDKKYIGIPKVPQSFNVPEDTAYFAFQIAKTDTTPIYQADLDAVSKLVQVEQADVCTEYEPYTGGVPKLYSDQIGVTAHGKNLFDLEYAKSLKNWKSGTAGYYYIPYYVGNGNVVTVTYESELQQGLEAYICLNKTAGQTDGSYGWLYHNGSQKLINNKIVLVSNADYLYLNAAGKIIDVLKKMTNFQIEVSPSPTTYEPYHEPQSLSIQTPTGLPAIPVDTDGNYTDANGQQWIADYVDLKLGKLYKKVTRLNLKDVDVTNIVHGFHSNGNGYLSFSIKNVDKEQIPISNRYKGSIWTVKSGYVYAPNSNSIVLVDDRFTDKQTAIKLVQDTYVIYVLTSQIETDLTPEEIQAYKNLVTYAGTTIVENDVDCYMEVSAGGGDALRAKKLALILGE